MILVTIKNNKPRNHNTQKAIAKPMSSFCENIAKAITIIETTMRVRKISSRPLSIFITKDIIFTNITHFPEIVNG